ncbi:MAG: porin family protein [Gammaproteobacteria bacterium]
MQRLPLALGSFALAMVLVPATAHAGGFEHSVNGWTGWYAGVQLGVNSNSYNGFGSSSAFAQELTGGYTYQVNSNLVLGGDLYTVWNTDTDHSVDSMPGYNANYGSRGLGAEFLAGFAVDNFLPYFKVGYGHLNISGNLSGSANGARYGAGVMWRITANSGVLLQYTYQKVSIPNNLSNGDFKNSNIMLGYNWYF